ncbi:MAG: hypothetical protein EA424_05460 [Planctomycetaceae bacterium]|nr:MAG: hypothetical protein EA424_05460 [Planctomycetaceae bacterium]
MTADASDSSSKPAHLAPAMGGRTRGVIDRSFLLVLGAILLLAFWLRLVQVRESLWLDELHTAWTVADSWHEIAWRAQIGNQSPLYFYLVGVTTWVMGLDELAVRLPSLLAGVGLVGLGGWLVAGWTGSRSSGWLVALLLTVDRTCLFYAQEARPYAWVQLVGLIHIALFVMILSRPRVGWRVAWVLTAWLVYYLHYTSVLLLAAELIAYAVLSIFPRSRPSYRIRCLAIDLTCIAIGIFPSLPWVLQIAAHRDAWSAFISSQVPIRRILAVFPLGIYLVLPAVIGAVGWLLHFGWRGIRSYASRSAMSGESSSQLERPPGRWSTGARIGLDPRLLVVLICWLFVPLSLAWLLTVSDVARLFFPRYLVVSAAAPALLAGLIFSRYPNGLIRLAGGLAVTATLIGHGALVPQWLHDGRVIGDRRQDWRGAVDLLRQRTAGKDIPIFVRSGLIEADRLRSDTTPRLHDYCLLPVLGIYHLDIPDENLVPLPFRWRGDFTQPQLDRILRTGRVWMLLAGTPRDITMLRRRLARSPTIDGAPMRLVEHHTFGNVALLHYELGDSDSARTGSGVVFEQQRTMWKTLSPKTTPDPFCKTRQ